MLNYQRVLLLGFADRITHGDFMGSNSIHAGISPLGFSGFERDIDGYHGGIILNVFTNFITIRNVSCSIL